MNEILSPIDDRLLFVLWDSTLKGTLLLALAGAASLAASRASAATRHLIFSAAFAGVFLVPCLSHLLPEWRVGWIPQWLTANTLLAIDPKPSVQFIEPGSAREFEANLTAFEQSRIPDPAPDDANAAAPVEIGTVGTVIPAVKRNAVGHILANPTRAIFLIWAVGLIVSLFPFGIGTILLARLTRRGVLCSDPSWTKQLIFLSAQLRLGRTSELRMSDRVRSPLTWGFWRPVLLLPTSAQNWSVETRRVVLLHELAHVKRFDWLTQTMAYVVCSIYWFNPLAWWAARRMRIEREAACDDAVLAAGPRPADYADDLLKLASVIMQHRLVGWAAVPMAQRSTLEGRLVAILDGTRNRRALTRTQLVAVMVLVAIVAMPVAMMRGGAITPGTELKRGEALDLSSGKVVFRDEVLRSGAPFIALDSLESVLSTKRKLVMGGGRPPLLIGFAVSGVDVAFGSPEQFERPELWDKIVVQPSATENYLIETNMDENRPLIYRTHDGVRGILKIDSADNNSIQIEHVRRQQKAYSRADVPTTEKAAADRRFAATLANGTYIEILGVTRNPSKGMPWWKPDGSPLARPLYINERNVFGSARGNRTAYEIATSIVVPPTANDVSTRIIVVGNSGSGTLTPVDPSGNKLRDIRADAYLIDADRASTDIKIGVAIGPWTSAFATVKAVHVDAPHAADLTDPKETKRGFSVTLTRSIGWNEFATRFVAIDRAGKIHTPDEQEVRDIKQKPGTQMWTYGFDTALPLVQVREFRFEYQPFQEAEFKDVSLRPAAVPPLPQR